MHKQRIKEKKCLLAINSCTADIFTSNSELIINSMENVAYEIFIASLLSTTQTDYIRFIHHNILNNFFFPGFLTYKRFNTYGIFWYTIPFYRHNNTYAEV